MRTQQFGIQLLCANPLAPCNGASTETNRLKRRGKKKAFRLLASVLVCVTSHCSSDYKSESIIDRVSGPSLNLAASNYEGTPSLQGFAGESFRKREREEQPGELSAEFRCDAPRVI